MVRIRRSSDDPVFQSEAVKGKPKTLVIGNAPEASELQYYRTNWSRISHDFDNVRHRTTLGRIMHADAHVGSFEVREFRCRPFVNCDDFYEEMDSHSHETFSLADAVCSGWSDLSTITDYGDIVELSKTWLDQSITNPNYLSLVITAIISRLCPSGSLTILKAFPLEYEGVVSDENRVAFQQRQRAMMRHYQRRLKFVPLPGARGEEGWMYRLPPKFADLVPEPDLT